MKKSEVIRKSLEQTVDTITMAIFFILFFLGAYALLDAHLVNQDADMDEKIISLAPDAVGGEINFAELKAINPEIIGWIKLDNTNINYPIVQGKDNSKYLIHGYDDEYNASGAIFMDSRNNEWQDDYTIIYGHHLDSSKMFGELTKYAEKTFFNDHTTGTLYTEEANFHLEALSYSVINTNSTSIYQLDINKNHHNDTIQSELMKTAIQFTDSDSISEKIILLSTCDKNSRYSRDVLLLRITTE